MNKLLKYSTAQVARLYRFAVFTQPIFALAASSDENREGRISVEEENHTRPCGHEVIVGCLPRAKKKE